LEWADTALKTFRPALNVSHAEYAELRYRLTTLPARPELLVTVALASTAIPTLTFIPIDLLERMDSGELEGMTDLNMAIASLEIEQSALNRIPTWPWQPETLLTAPISRVS
jgi:hypothetical protein